MFVRIGSVSALLLSVALVAVAQTSPATQPELIAQLEAIDAVAAPIKDLAADFEQRKYSALLTDPLITRGEVRAKDGIMLWRGDTPEPTRMRVTLARMQIYYVKQNLVEDYPITGKLGSLAASPLPRLATLRERFTITRDDAAGLPPPKDIANPLTVRLTPTEAEVKQYVDHIRVTLDPTRGIVTTFEITDPDGERSTIAFTNVRTNVGVDEASLALGAASNAKVVKPLEPGK